MPQSAATSDELLIKTENIKLKRDMASEKLDHLTASLNILTLSPDPDVRSTHADLKNRIHQLRGDLDHVREGFDTLYNLCIRAPDRLEKIGEDGRSKMQEDLNTMEEFSNFADVHLELIEIDILTAIANCVSKDSPL